MFKLYKKYQELKRIRLQYQQLQMYLNRIYKCKSTMELYNFVHTHNMYRDNKLDNKTLDKLVNVINSRIAELKQWKIKFPSIFDEKGRLKP